jgi:UDP-N-acetylmuramoyl-tripeptide--D-alanyl-D-alanine ligase
MDPRTLRQIADWVGGKVHGKSGVSVSHVVTDSRSSHSGDFFVALRGEQFDGHDFLTDVQEAGVSGALVSKVRPDLSVLNQIEVPDTLQGLQQMARAYRKELRLKSVGVTGSNGKTSTKEMTASVLGERLPVTKTIGNYNNHIGLPLTILGASSEDEVGVFEMGMNHPGELMPLCEIACPDAAIITNIGVAHIGYLGSREAIAAEKAVVAESVPAGGYVVLNANDDFTDWIAARIKARVIRAGINAGDLQAREIQHTQSGESFMLVYGLERVSVRLPVHGEHMVTNACLAAGAGLGFGLTLQEIAAGLAKTAIPGNRLKVQKLGPVLVINDAYNANPESMVAALKTATSFDIRGRRIAALGRMGELGKESDAGHRRVGRAVAELAFDYLITVGDEARLIAEAASRAGLKRTREANTHEQAVEALLDYLEPGDLLLVKGSLSSAMDRVVRGLEAAKASAGWRSR